jgi:DNA polymerase I-like protein with 3'-5' exonuclease and polymerase domains
MNNKLVACDTESFGGGAFGALKKLYSVQFAYEDGTAEVYPIFAPTFADALAMGGLAALNAKEVLDRLHKVESIVFANAAHDMSVLLGFYGEHLQAKFAWDDVLLLSWCLNPNRPFAAGEQHSLKSWGERLDFPKDFLDVKWDDIHVQFENVKAEDIDHPLMHTFLEYGKQDALLTMAIYQELLREAMTLPPKVLEGAMRIYELVEHPTVALVMEMQGIGLLVDVPHLEALWDEWADKLDAMEAEIQEFVGRVPGKSKKLKKPLPEYKLEDHIFDGQNEKGEYLYRELVPFNLNSGEQLAWVLQQQGWEPTEFSPKTGKPVVSKDQLNSLAGTYEIANKMLEFRKFEKLFTTYVVSMATKGKANGGWIHPSWKQNGTLTGRYSCSNSNFQNLASRDEEGQLIRKAVIAPPGMKLVGIDLQAIEYRVLADQMACYFFDHTGEIPSDVEFMLDAFIKRKDIHTVMAQLWFKHKTDYEENAKKYRKLGKNVSYGRAFGFSAGRAAKMMGVSEEEARAIIATADASNPSFKTFQEWVLDSVIENGGWGFTAFGRPHYYPDICLKPSKRTREAIARAKRQAFNARIQGTAADINKLLHIDLNTSITVSRNVLDKVRHTEYAHLYERMEGLNTMPIVKAFGAWNVGTVHDELLFYVPEENAEAFAAALTLHYRDNWEYMRFCPIDGTAQYGDNWSEIK